MLSQLKNLFKNQQGASPLFIIIILVLLAGAGFYFFQDKLNLNKPQQSASTEIKNIGIVQFIKPLDTVSEGFKKGMADLGYTEGKDVNYDYQSADSDPKKTREIIKGFIEKDVDLIVAVTSVSAKIALEESTAAAKLKGTEPIPVVYGAGDNSVRQGIIKDLKSSGNNLTGVENTNAENVAKKYEFLKRINPEAKTVGIFTADPTHTTPATLASLNEAKGIAQNLGLTVKVYEINSAPGPQSTQVIQSLADKVQSGEIDAIMQLPDPLTNYQQNYKILIDLGKKLKVPTLFLDLPRAEDGALIAFNADYTLIGSQMSVMADKILKGTKPTDIPIELPRKTVLWVNLKTASDIGVTIPDSILAIADRKIN